MKPKNKQRFSASKQSFSASKRRRKFSTFIIIYLLLGAVFAFSFAIYYHWTPLAYFSPGFYGVVFSWPYQAIGFTRDLFYYGISGPPVI